ncbi:hypothetical protein [Paraburkholderia adhaesiva]|uniref:hypothetical protein n=1 Tax=Paraburkholderia adhaesiva TaxID=2883244 RepID=UPI001F34BF33|nr:hypothetical protein [Paraburkholderia adhaesiva]
MEPVWEWKWSYWDEAQNRFEATPVWMTDAEACSDFWAYNDERSHKLEHTKRDRNSTTGIEVDPPEATIDWKREVRRRRERSQFGLPPFVTPTYEDLRKIWVEHPHPVPRRLALEVQTGRYAIFEIAGMAAEAYWYLDRDSTTVEDCRRELRKLRRRLMAELNRIGPVDRQRNR